MAVADDTVSQVCPQCMAPFAPQVKVGRPNRYCSAGCRVEAKNQARYKRWRSGVYAPGDTVPKRKQAATACEHCGALTTRPRFCSVGCSHGARAVVLGIFTGADRICAECESPYSARMPHSRFCSRTCQRKSINRSSTAIRRARIAGLERERFDPLEVFERDGWRCHLCGRKTIKKLRGKYAKLSPELDHIIPVSRGGPHTRANTACSCHECNNRKHNRILGQPSLLAA